jgi:hypothetical protein
MPSCFSAARLVIFFGISLRHGQHRFLFHQRELLAGHPQFLRICQSTVIRSDEQISLLGDFELAQQGAGSAILKPYFAPGFLLIRGGDLLDRPLDAGGAEDHERRRAALGGLQSNPGGPGKGGQAEEDGGFLHHDER